MNLRIATDGAGVHVAQMAQIEQVVVNQLVGRLVVICVALELIQRVVVPGMGWRFAQGLRFGRAAHPDPHKLVALFQWIRANTSHFRNMRLTRDFGATAVRHEQKAVVAATDRWSFDGSTGKGKMAMTAAILQCGHLAIGPKQYNGLSQ